MLSWCKKNAYDRVNHRTLTTKLLNRNVPFHIVKLFIFWHAEQEFMVRWGNSLSMIFRCSNGIRQGWQLSPLLYNVYTDDLNHHVQETGVGCYVGGAWVNSLSYADDAVLQAPTVTALQTLLEVYVAHAGPHDIVYNMHNENSMYAGPTEAITELILNKSQGQARKWGTYHCNRVSLPRTCHDCRLSR